VLILVRAKKLQDTAAKIRDDQVMYDEVWHNIRTNSESLEVLGTLQTVVSRITQSITQSQRGARAVIQARQYNRKKDESDAQEFSASPPMSTRHSRGRSSGPGPNRLQTRAVRRWKSLENLFVPSLAKRDSSLDINDVHQQVDFDSPVMDLDQLFVQAEGVYPLLRAKTRAWALVSHGLLLRIEENVKAKGEDQEGYLPPTPPPPPPPKKSFQEVDYDAPIKWAKLKRPERAIEKVLRSYGGDASRLCDICRQSIVFDSIASLQKCVEVIAADTEVTIVRVKNRLDPAYDSSLSLGYRDVAFNLRICTKEAFDLGVETHVCELQLIMETFAANKSDQGHTRYVEFRNARAE